MAEAAPTLSLPIGRSDNESSLLMELQSAGPEWRSLQTPTNRQSPTGLSALVGGTAVGSRTPGQEETPMNRRRKDEVLKMQGILDFKPLRRPPRVLCVSRRHCRKNKYVDIVGEYHLELMQNYGGVPIVIPRTTKTVFHLAEYLPMDGLVIAEGELNQGYDSIGSEQVFDLVGKAFWWTWHHDPREPSFGSVVVYRNDLSDDILVKYGCQVPGRLDAEAAQKYAGDTEFDESKDELEFALVRFALAAGCPILTFCRGCQMLNALRGGTLIGDIDTEVNGGICHLKDSSDPEYDTLRHPIRVVPETPLAQWFSDSLGGTSDLQVNSYHHQACKTLGEGLKEMARSPDGIIEAFYDTDYDPENGRYVVGLQFHPERMLSDYAGCARVYEEFLKACHNYKALQEGKPKK